MQFHHNIMHPPSMMYTYMYMYMYSQVEVRGHVLDCPCNMHTGRLFTTMSSARVVAAEAGILLTFRRFH